eukprot:3787214-Prymnesium_polylepis.1
MVLLSLDVSGCAAASAAVHRHRVRPAVYHGRSWLSSGTPVHRTSMYGRSGQSFLEDLTDRRAFTAG